MKEYEVVAKYYNACAGESRPETYFDEIELGDTDSFVRMKHGHDFDKFTKEIVSPTQILYNYNNGSIAYRYEFTEI